MNSVEKELLDWGRVYLTLNNNDNSKRSFYIDRMQQHRMFIKHCAGEDKYNKIITKIIKRLTL